MGPTYLCKGIMIVGLILLWFALFFNSAIAMVLATSLLIMILWRLFSFQQTMKQVLDGIECHRDVPANFVRAGSSFEVRLSILVSVPGGFHARIREKVSPGMVVQKGDLDYYINGEKTELAKLSYSAAPMVHGTLSFPGITVRLTDRFFSDEINLLNDRFIGPVLTVYPYGNYDLALGLDEYGEQELERIRLISGGELSGFREYVPGDDMKHIDWKMTAKYDKPVVRVYTGISGTNPLFILDLPEQLENTIPANFHPMVRAVSGSIEESWKKNRKSSLVLISGPNIIKTPEQGESIGQSLSILNASAYPVKRSQTYYRFQTKGSLRARNGEILRIMRGTHEGPDAYEYLTKIGSIVSSSLKDPSGDPAFHGEISRILRMWPHETVIIFTLGSGDMSHIRYLIEQVHHDHGTVQLHVPADPGVPGFMRMCVQSGADSVKVFS